MGKKGGEICHASDRAPSGGGFSTSATLFVAPSGAAQPSTLGKKGVRYTFSKKILHYHYRIIQILLATFLGRGPITMQE